MLELSLLKHDQGVVKSLLQELSDLLGVTVTRVAAVAKQMEIKK